MIKRLIKLANELDSKGLRKEADYVDQIILKIAEGEGYMIRDIYSTGALEKEIKEGGRGEFLPPPKEYSSFYEVWEDLWMNESSGMFKSFDDYMKVVKSLEHNRKLGLGEDGKMKAATIYESPSPPPSGSGY